MFSETEKKNDTPSLSPGLIAGLFGLSAATLAFEINLTRLFSVAQFYHFAFMIVSLALLGFGSSGTLLAVFPRLGRGSAGLSLDRLACATGVSMLAAYLMINWLPFDSFSIAWDRRQAAVLVAHYLVLALPFFFSGMATGILLAAMPQLAGRTYAVNLTGSAIGCALALAAPAALGGEGMVTLSAGLAGLSALAFSRTFDGSTAVDNLWQTRISQALGILLLGFSLVDLGSRISGLGGLSFMELNLSPYKSFSYTLQAPDARMTYRRWNAFSRVDRVESASIHSLPGLSYRYLQALPPEDGLFVDGDNLSPVFSRSADLTFSAYLPSAAAFELRPGAEAIILEPRGGLDVLVALASGASRVTAVEVNPLIVDAARQAYDDPNVTVIHEFDRSYLRRSQERVDVVVISLANSFHPIRSGAYSLGEDYRYTVEAFRDALARLNPQGVLTVTRWLQSPPSEFLRAFATAVTALEESGLESSSRIAAFRSYNTGTLLVKREPFTADELAALRSFSAERAFDLVYTPDIQPQEANQFNILREPEYFQSFQSLMAANSREDFYAAYPFNVRPQRDDHPFYDHYFKWSQAWQVWSELGKTWQPFGGAGYFVILALLVLAVAGAAVLILLPAVVFRRTPGKGRDLRLQLPSLGYFALIGVGFFLVEIPLIQQFILFLGHPAYALTAVLFTLLLFSGLGSRWSDKLPVHVSLVLLVMLVLSLPAWLPVLFSAALPLSFTMRLVITALVLAPAGLLMGVSFPGGIGWMLAEQPQRAENVPWIWAVNGAASVIASVLAALLALSFGFTWVLRLGAACYLGAWFLVMASGRFRLRRLPR